MKEQQFRARHEAFWQRMQQSLSFGRKQAVNDGDWPKEFRLLCEHLALAQRRLYSPQLIDRLNQMVLAGHHQLYGSRAGLLQQVLYFVRAGFPRRMRQEWRVLLVASLCLLLPALILGLVIQWRPEFVYTVVSHQEVANFEWMYQPHQKHLGRRSADADMYMWGYYIFNNVGIDFRCFAGGLLAGLGSLLFMLYNGLLFGAVAGHLTRVGLAENFFSFVVTHSALELTAAAISGAAGLKIGMALLFPGQRLRRDALREAGRAAIELLVGAAVMTFLAAFIEAFWSSSSLIAPWVKFTVGGALWGSVFWYFWRAGRAT